MQRRVCARQYLALRHEIFTHFSSYVDNLSSTLYRPWQTVAYAEGERYAVLTAPDCSPTLCHSLGCAV